MRMLLGANEKRGTLKRHAPGTPKYARGKGSIERHVIDQNLK
jgi:hypothetical protein